MRLGHAPILAGRLDRGCGLHGLAERLHGDARRRRDVILAGGDVGYRLRFGTAWLAFHHVPGSFAQSLILA
jgi:hypothetical protein